MAAVSTTTLGITGTTPSVYDSPAPSGTTPDRGDALRDPRTHALATEVCVAADDNPDPNALVPQSLTVRLRNGHDLHWTCDQMLASAARPLTQAQHLAKVRMCCTFAARPWHDAETDALIAAVETLETLPDLRALIALLR